MHQDNAVIIDAPKERIFEVTSNLENWPKLLPHYRYIQYLERDAPKTVVKMAARRGVIPISWVSEHEVDRDRWQMRFRHLRAFTKGMEVVWLYEDTPQGVRVTIKHDMRFRIPALAFVMEPLIARGFIAPVATKTLATFKRLLESGEPLTAIGERS